MQTKATPSRRQLLCGLATGLTASFVYRDALGASPREIRISDTTAMHEMPLYAMPEFLGPQYTAKHYNFGSSGTSQLAALMSGACDVMSNANSYLINARAEGAKVVAICGLAGKGQAIVARGDRGINRFEDLRGKKLVTRRMTSSHVMLQILLRSIGIDPTKDVTIMDVGQPAGFNLAIERGDADAGQLWEPFVSIAAAKPGIRKLELDRFFELTWRTHSSLFVSQKLIDEEPQLVRDLVAATIKAIDSVNQDRNKYLSITTKHVGQPEPILLAAIENCNPRIEMDATMFYRMAEEMFSLGMIRSDVAPEIEPYINYRFVSEAAKKTPAELGFVSYADYKAGKKTTIR